MNKKLLTFITLISLTSLLACTKHNGGNTSSGDDDDNRPYEQGEAKNNKGFGTLFNEVLGYNTKDASVIQDGNERYITYASNETEKGAQVFAARKATLENGKWSYGAKKIVFRPTESGWDQRISNPAVVKGTFNYQGTAYQYLMAYNATDGSDFNNHIGLAVSNDLLTEWKRVGNKPILENPEVQESAYGYGSPSLISYDQGGKGYMFYAAGETDVSYEAVKTYDFSDLDHPVLEAGYSSMPITGITDKVEGNAVIVNAGFALSNDGNNLYMVRDRLPQSASRPNQSTEVEVARASKNIVRDFGLSWTVTDNVTGMKTMDMEDPDSLGWDEIYSGEFVTDPYGKLLPGTTAELIYSTFDEESSAPAYSSTLASYEVQL